MVFFLVNLLHKEAFRKGARVVYWDDFENLCMFFTYRGFESLSFFFFINFFVEIAQMGEQHIRNMHVRGSSPLFGMYFFMLFKDVF